MIVNQHVNIVISGPARTCSFSFRTGESKSGNKRSNRYVRKSNSSES